MDSSTFFIFNDVTAEAQSCLDRGQRLSNSQQAQLLVLLDRLRVLEGVDRDVFKIESLLKQNSMLQER